jgi:uncharacterized protein with ATP-grasp and redox domains
MNHEIVNEPSIAAKQSCLLLSNNTSVRVLFERILEQFKSLLSRKSTTVTLYDVNGNIVTDNFLDEVQLDMNDLINEYTSYEDATAEDAPAEEDATAEDATDVPVP